MTANRPLRPGDPAPRFALPAVNREGVVALEDYRGKTPVLVGLFRGLHCPFCRRHVAQLGITRDKLAREGVETLAIVNTPVERARQYFQYRPTRVSLAADPDARTHAAFGVPAIEFLPDDTSVDKLQWPQRATWAQLLAPRLNPTGELPEPLNMAEAMDALNKKDGFELTEADQKIYAAHASQLTGHFLIDSNGTIRWAQVEALDRLEDFAKFPSDDEILAATRALSR